MELCFNVRTFLSTVYPFRSFLTTTHRMTGKRFYLIETMDEMVIDDPRAYQAPHPIFTCSPDEIELIHKTQDAI